MKPLGKNKLRNCPVCGRLFTDMGTGVCNHCYEEQRETERTVIEYVRQHPNTTVAEICEETGAPLKLITNMVQRGQFLDTGGQILYPCKSCGKPIAQGKYCVDCLGKLNKEIQASSERAKMRMYHKDDMDTASSSRKHSLHLKKYLDN